jgi:hypothetical protein
MTSSGAIQEAERINSSGSSGAIPPDAAHSNVCREPGHAFGCPSHGECEFGFALDDQTRLLSYLAHESLDEALPGLDAATRKHPRRNEVVSDSGAHDLGRFHNESQQFEANCYRLHDMRRHDVGQQEGCGMEAEPREDKVCVWMTEEEAQNLLREIDKWPELPKVERDLVDALKKLPHTS